MSDLAPEPREPVCFTCGHKGPLVPGHIVCEACHASRGQCGRCFHLRPELASSSRYGRVRRRSAETMEAYQ